MLKTIIRLGIFSDKSRVTPPKIFGAGVVLYPSNPHRRCINIIIAQYLYPAKSYANTLSLSKLMNRNQKILAALSGLAMAIN